MKIQFAAVYVSTEMRFGDLYNGKNTCLNVSITPLFTNQPPVSLILLLWCYYQESLRL